MIVDMVKDVINRAKAAGMYDRLVVKADSGEMYYVNNQSQTCCFDFTSETLYCLKINHDSSRVARGDCGTFKIIGLTFDHISHIGYTLDGKELLDVMSNYDFDAEDVSRVLSLGSGSRTNASKIKTAKDHNPSVFIPSVTVNNGL